MNKSRPWPLGFPSANASVWFLVLLAMVGVAPDILANPKDDVIILHNGDRMTGEVKSLQFGVLSFKADYMTDSVKLDWKRVSRIESKGQYIVTLTNGALYTGSVHLATPAQDTPGDFVIRVGNVIVSVRQDEVRRILPSESTFLEQLNGSIDFGFGYTSGNSQYQSQLDAAANYRRGNNTFMASTDINLSGQSGGNKTERYNLDLQYRRLFQQRWFAGGLLDFLRDEHQSLDLRTAVGGLIGRGVIVTDRTNLSIGSGMVITRERYDAALGVPPATNAEALVGLDFHTFRFKTTDITSRFVVYPSITVPGRVRMDLDTNLRIELVKDFFWGLNLFDNFDSKPPVSARKNDLGISTSFGWKF